MPRPASSRFARWLPLVLVLVAGPGLAQSSSVPSARQRALADSIVRLTEKHTGGFHATMNKALGGAGLEGEAGARMASRMQRFWEKVLPADTLRAFMVDDFATGFTGPELASLLRFYRTDLGVKLLAHGPKSMEKTQRRIQRVMLENREEMMKMMMEGAREP